MARREDNNRPSGHRSKQILAQKPLHLGPMPLNPHQPGSRLLARRQHAGRDSHPGHASRPIRGRGDGTCPGKRKAIDEEDEEEQQAEDAFGSLKASTDDSLVRPRSRRRRIGSSESNEQGSVISALAIVDGASKPACSLSTDSSTADEGNELSLRRSPRLQQKTSPQSVRFPEQAQVIRMVVAERLEAETMVNESRGAHSWIHSNTKAGGKAGR